MKKEVNTKGELNMFYIDYAKKCFKNHKATLSDYGNIKVLDFKNPESSEYRIRFIFEEDYYRLHISGDLGELIATNPHNMTYEKFDDFVRDIGYFEGKINCCSEPLYYYDEETIKEDVLTLITESGTVEEFVENYREDSVCSSEDNTEDVLDVFFDALLKDFSGEMGLSQSGHEFLAGYLENEYEAWSSNIGKRSTEIFKWYMFAFQLAQEQLRNANKEQNEIKEKV